MSTFFAKLLDFSVNHYLLVSALFALLVLLFFYEKSKAGKSLLTFELTSMVNTNQAIILDIRSSKDFSIGHIANSINIPAEKLESRYLELEKYKNKTIILVDAHGQHSGGYGGRLQKQGYTVAKLSGGIGSWKNDNLPLVK